MRKPGQVLVFMALVLAFPQLDAASINTRKLTAKRELSLLRSIETLDYDTEKYRQRLRAINKKVATLQKSKKQLTRRVAALAAQVKEYRRYFAGRVGAIRFIKQRGSLQLLMSSSSFSRYVRKKWLLQRLVQQDQEKLRSLQQAQKQLSDEQTALQKLTGSLAEMQQNLRTDQQRLEKLRSEKTAILDSIKKRRGWYLRYQEEMSWSTRRLMREVLNARKRMKKRPFASLRKRMQRPIRGYLLKRFGPQVDRRFRTVTQHNGLLFRARMKQRVRSAYSGRVVFVGMVGGYGRVIIVDHTRNLFSLYGHLHNFAVKKGQFVTRGSLLAYAGRSGIRRRPAVYFEIRERGKAVDPFLYLRR